MNMNLVVAALLFIAATCIADMNMDAGSYVMRSFPSHADTSIAFDAEGMIIELPMSSYMMVQQGDSGDDSAEQYTVYAVFDGTTWHTVTPMELVIMQKTITTNFPKIYRVKRGYSWASIWVLTNVPVDSLRVWNDAEDRHPYAGETIFIEPSPSDLHRWCFLGGNPAGLPLVDQLDIRDVPVPVIEEWKHLIETTEPDTVMIVSTDEDPLVVKDLTFGGSRKGTVLEVWKQAVCYWTDLHTLERIDSTLAISYDPVEHDSVLYDIYQVLACNNAYHLDWPVPRKPLFVELEGPDTTKPPEEPGELPKKSWFLNEDLLTYFVREFVRQIDHPKGDHENTFAGAELIIKSLSPRWLDWNLRADGSVMHKSWTFTPRFAPRIHLTDNVNWWFALEPGVRWGRKRIIWREYSSKPGEPSWVEYDRYRSAWGYDLRLLGTGPNKTFIDGWYVHGANFDEKYSLSFTRKPGRRYSTLSFELQRLPGETIDVNGQSKSFTRTNHLRLRGRYGYQVMPSIYICGQYDYWHTRTISEWDSERHGPGVYVETYPWSNLQLWSEILYLRWMRDEDLVTWDRYYDDLWRINIGLSKKFL